MSQEIQFILYNLPNEDGKIQVIIKDETMWCTQKAMAQLFGVGVPAISKHLSNIYNERELDPLATISKMETVQEEGNRNIRRTTQKTTQKLTKMQNDILDFIRTTPTASRKEVTDNIANSTEDGIWNVLSEGYEQEI